MNRSHPLSTRAQRLQRSIRKLNRKRQKKAAFDRMIHAKTISDIPRRLRIIADSLRVLLDKRIEFFVTQAGVRVRPTNWKRAELFMSFTNETTMPNLQPTTSAG